MSRLRRNVLAAGAILILGVAACNTNDRNGGGTQPTPTPVAQCPVGDWRSTQVAASASVVGVTITAQGGSGVKMTIAADGAVHADVTGMQPIGFSAQAAAAQVKGEFLYQGSIDGKVNLSGATATTSGGPTPGTASPTPGVTTSTTSPAATPTPAMTGASPGATTSPGSSGVWQPVGEVKWGDLRLTVRVTEPMRVTVIDNVRISDVTGAQTSQAGNAVDIQPLLRPGQYRCDGNDTLVITPSGGTPSGGTPSGGPTITWTFQRAM